MENEKQDGQKPLVLVDAMEHFLKEVYPKLFLRRRFKNKEYQRVHSFISAYKKALKGEPNEFTPTRAIRILTEYGGEVNGAPRYSFEVVVYATIEEELPLPAHFQSARKDQILIPEVSGTLGA